MIPVILYVCTFPCSSPCIASRPSAIIARAWPPERIATPDADYADAPTRLAQRPRGNFAREPNPRPAAHPGAGAMRATTAAAVAVLLLALGILATCASLTLSLPGGSDGVRYGRNAAVLSSSLAVTQARAARAEAEAIDLRGQVASLRRQLEARTDIAPGVAHTSGSAAASRGEAIGGWEETEDSRKLAAALSSAASARREVLLGLANDVMMCTNPRTCWWNGGNVLDTFLKALRRLHVPNALVISLDNATHSFVQRVGGATSLRLSPPVPSAQHGSRGANMISTLKYGLLEQATPSPPFTHLHNNAETCPDRAGLSAAGAADGVRCSRRRPRPRLPEGLRRCARDVREMRNGHAMIIPRSQDPFAHLHRDSDIEASTDGFTEKWSKGSMDSIREPKMGWGGGGLWVKHFTLNVGCAFIRPTPKAIALMARVGSRLRKDPAWDQQVFNEEAFYLSHGAYNGSAVGVRVMAYDQWVNSKARHAHATPSP